LKSLEEIGLIEARHGAGWFVSPLTETNLAKAHQIAASVKGAVSIMETEEEPTEVPAGPRRLPVAPENH